MATSEDRLLIRDILHCKPGKVRPMVEKFLEMAGLYEERRGGGHGSGSAPGSG